ncbi:winged helix-turn-helix transcriptional regulator [Aliarcobacter vitoriensis]|uniref:Transcriptional regulator n=1 Tax=Aliarcobacter vitoriensis TaxID=2011099 RepID=A0A366MUD3_9BACT|nr:helix-turn-helix domain-containing protein [Aliarcobacter vitoriensis]RBQ29878.1 transcriptional regulator [Aliarcobacter vitoriensis]
MIELNGKEYECPSKIPMDLVDDKWKFLILWNLATKPLRVSELTQKMPDISQRTLSRKLKALEEVSLVHRVVFPEVPPKVEYSLTIHGERLLEVFEIMSKWGEKYAKEMGAKIY